MFGPKLTVKFFKGSCSTSFDVRKALTHCSERVFSLLVSLVLDFPVNESLIEREVGSAV